MISPVECSDINHYVKEYSTVGRYIVISPAGIRDVNYYVKEGCAESRYIVISPARCSAADHYALVVNMNLIIIHITFLR